ncbi:DinB family protein [Antarcticibacterium arcticum]|uniref:DinB family protein n=1 Tax=Antarcticibacterium arcticum TaxID=2585771 RepID=A0A5B8YN03_9FLAO|nr:DinB family protein [Antarcticibacterium arcticum]QED38003.1 DinB family protein [Antarcticibacterium arcticum]
MKTDTAALIKDLSGRTEKVLAEARELQQRSLEELNQRASPGSWSALEAIQHLNLYGNYYLPEIEKAVISGEHKAEPIFKSGFLGDYFAKMMLPGEKSSKMKTFKDKDPLGKELDQGVIDLFIKQQIKMLDLLKRSVAVSYNKTRIPLSFLKFIKLKLGDILRIVIYHNQRHMLQAQMAVNGDI